MFSDEFRYCLWANDGCRRVRQRRGERWKIQFRTKRGTVLTGELSLFLAINRNTQDNILDVLEPITKQYLKKLENTIFQQDVRHFEVSSRHSSSSLVRYICYDMIDLTSWLNIRLMKFKLLETQFLKKTLSFSKHTMTS